MRFCSQCGASVALGIPPGDRLPRHICSQCGTVHYQNPKLVVGCIPEWHDQVLLCRRAIEPRIDRWTLPAGFMENAEGTDQGAARECLEEANARVTITAPYTLFTLPRVDQVYLLFRSQLLDLDFSPGEESREVALFREQDIPWDDLAFTTVRKTLEHFFADRHRGHFGFYVDTLY